MKMKVCLTLDQLYRVASEGLFLLTSWVCVNSATGVKALRVKGPHFFPFVSFEVILSVLRCEALPR